MIVFALGSNSFGDSSLFTLFADFGLLRSRAKLPFRLPRKVGHRALKFETFGSRLPVSVIFGFLSWYFVNLVLCHRRSWQIIRVFFELHPQGLDLSLP